MQNAYYDSRHNNMQGGTKGVLSVKVLSVVRNLF